MNRTCLKCGWVHFGVTLSYAVEEVNRFNQYFESLSTEEQQNNYGGKGSDLERYLVCACCGGSYINFRDAKPQDCPDGCTLNPIVVEEDSVEDLSE